MDTGHKTCPDCAVSKPLDDFYRAKDRRDGRGTYCRDCHRTRMGGWRSRNKAEHRAMIQEWRRQHPERVQAEHRSGRLRRIYGLSIEQYDALLERQGGACALCRAPQENFRYPLAVDHDHACCPAGTKTCGGCTRGLLCAPCNTSLGQLGDSADAIERVLAYARGRA